MAADLRTFDGLMRDHYPRFGERIKQYVVDERAQAAWERATCPVVDVPRHEDNTGAVCRDVGSAPWTYLDHDCCYVCGDLYRATEMRPDIVEWRKLRDARPPIEADRTKLSDEVQGDYGSLAEHPLLGMLRKEKR